MKEYEEKRKAVVDFYREAYCVDGEVSFVNPAGYQIESVIKLTDTKRGAFYIGKLTPPPPSKGDYLKED